MPATRVIAAAIDEINRTFAGVLAEDDGYTSASLAAFRDGYRSLAGSFASKGFSTPLTRLSLAAGDDNFPTADSDVVAIQRQIFNDANGATTLLAGRRTSSTDGLLDKLRAMIAATADQLEAESDGLWARG